ncbi:MAG TPA: hypothetical protein VKX17_16720 [Planctomycetota bacterium]|nr:hypothetical protein [Planctomycetota bacterium]
MGKVLSRPVAKGSRNIPRPDIAKRIRKTPFQRALDAAEALSTGELIALIDKLEASTREAKRARFIAEVREAEAECARGECFTGTADEVIKWLHD